MHTSHIRRSWRLALLVGTLVVAAFAIPSTASADAVSGIRCPGFYDASSQWRCSPGPIQNRHHPYAGWRGWGTVDANSCDPGRICAAIYRTSVQAWRWNGSWISASLTSGSQVYIYPYAVGWSWVWTQSTGWLAVSDSYVWVDSPVIYY